MRLRGVLAAIGLLVAFGSPGALAAPPTLRTSNASRTPTSAKPPEEEVIPIPPRHATDPATNLPSAEPEATDKPLPINLPTALRLAGGRPVIISAAQASVQFAEAELAKARLEWLPSLNAGVGYYRHDGATQGQSGNFYINTKENFLAGAGLTAKVATADALFGPLAARQVLRAREFDVQAARNDALLAAAEAYFNVQQARGRLASDQDVINKGLEFAKAIDFERVTRARPADLHRARALLASFEDAVATAREQWRTASADLTQVLRLDPTATVIPLEPPSLRVTLIPPQTSVDALIPVGLTNRPELASQQSLVQAALARIRQERMRPLVPSLILQGSPGSAGPGGYLMGGIFGSGAHGSGDPWLMRDDVSVGLVWEMQNLGLGNRALVRQREAERQQLLIDLFRIQDVVAGDIARAHAQLVSATARVTTSERGVQEAWLAYEEVRKNLDQVEHVGTTDVVVHRVFDVIDALRALSQALDRYFTGATDYNRAQFRLYRALGYPAGNVVCGSAGAILEVNTARPLPLPSVCAPDPCPCHR
jgi:outer membrane protein TolC